MLGTYQFCFLEQAIAQLFIHMWTDSLGREELLSISHQDDIEPVNFLFNYVAFAYLIFFAGFNQVSARHREPLLKYAMIVFTAL
ncbi:hypothetical protein L494_0508 [Bordetella bronchiseptica CA90 BB1334]|nr:hypothetical protein L576_0523 [Bordetella bronchiseptica OSU054]KDB76959.1 hypothetical protein L494_0508 [Bordetella bronchiseptica CA90 BB1334]KDD44195.1 hypothetical protein L532_0560 [Bordetella bronchiseptica OSU095]